MESRTLSFNELMISNKEKELLDIKCEMCGIGPLNQKNYNRHIRNHTFCTICNVRFSLKRRPIYHFTLFQAFVSTKRHARFHRAKIVRTKYKDIKEAQKKTGLQRKIHATKVLHCTLVDKLKKLTTFRLYCRFQSFWIYHNLHMLHWLLYLPTVFKQKQSLRS